MTLSPAGREIADQGEAWIREQYGKSADIRRFSQEELMIAWLAGYAAALDRATIFIKGADDKDADT